MLDVSLSCTLHRKNLLENIQFMLCDGERLDILGVNGAGKSTLLRCIAGLIPYSLQYGWQGKISLAKKNILEYTVKEKARIMAYVPQVHSEIPYFKVRDFLGFSRYALDMNMNHSSIEAALLRTQTKKLENKYLTTLSGGERQLVYIAAALVQEPKLLLLDEPAAFLDPYFESYLAALLQELNQDGMTLITVSHNINRVLQDAEKVLALSQGKCVFCGNISEQENTQWLEDIFHYAFTTLKHPMSGKLLVI